MCRSRAPLLHHSTAQKLMAQSHPQHWPASLGLMRRRCSCTACPPAFQLESKESQLASLLRLLVAALWCVVGKHPPQCQLGNLACRCMGDLLWHKIVHGNGSATFLKGCVTVVLLRQCSVWRCRGRIKRHSRKVGLHLQVVSASWACGHSGWLCRPACNCCNVQS
jgi:hypothetical protein